MTNSKQQTEVNKEFIPYELALELKQLGFDEDCFTFYQVEYHENSPIMVDDNDQYLSTGFRTCKNSEIPSHYISCPTFSQAFRWFREKHNLRCQINYIGGLINKTTWWDISVIGHYNTDPKEWEMKYQPYEEAELACLKKLIEIVNGKQ
jgi:hypothetical protein